MILLYYCENVGLSEYGVLNAVHLDLCAGVLADKHLVAYHDEFVYVFLVD